MHTYTYIYTHTHTHISTVLMDNYHMHTRACTYIHGTHTHTHGHTGTHTAQIALQWSLCWGKVNTLQTTPPFKNTAYFNHHSCCGYLVTTGTEMKINPQGESQSLSLHPVNWPQSMSLNQETHSRAELQMWNPLNQVQQRREKASLRPS